MSTSDISDPGRVFSKDSLSGFLPLPRTEVFAAQVDTFNRSEPMPLSRWDHEFGPLEDEKI
jgi:hypothetical protein